MTALKKKLRERGINEFMIIRLVTDGGFLSKNEPSPVLLPYTIMTRINLDWDRYKYISPVTVAETIKKYPECINHLVPEAKKVIGKKEEESIVKPETELAEDAGQESVIVREETKPAVIEKGTPVQIQQPMVEEQEQANDQDDSFKITDVESFVSEIDGRINKNNEPYMRSTIKLAAATELFVIGKLDHERLFAIADNSSDEAKINALARTMASDKSKLDSFSAVMKDRTFAPIFKVDPLYDEEWIMNMTIAHIIKETVLSMRSIIEERFGIDSEEYTDSDAVLCSIRKYFENFSEEKRSPIFFVNSNLNMESTPVSTVSKKTLNEIKDSMNKLNLLDDKAAKYQFNRVNDVVELVITRPNRLDSYIIDPGIIVGLGYCILCNYVMPNGMMDTIFVSIENTEIMRKVLKDSNYVLAPEEIQIVREPMFTNEKVYYMLDMSRGMEVAEKMTPEEYQRFGKKLTFIMNLTWTNNIPRMRIKKFISVDNFILTSDDKCKSPFATTNTTSPFIDDGLLITVKGDNVTVSNPKKSIAAATYGIENYGIL